MKFLVVGGGSIGRRHLQNLKQLAAGELMVFDIQEERGREVAKQNEAQFCPTFEQGLLQKPDAVLVCTPTSQHIPYALTAIQNDCHLFIEKPISHSLEGVDELVKTAVKRKRVVLVGCNFRFHWGIKLARQWVEAGKIGRVLFADAEFGQYLPDWHPWEDYRQGYSAQKALGGGVILDSIHELDYLYWFWGKIKEVYALADKLSRLEIDVEDMAEIILRFSNGIVARVHLDYLQRPYHRSLKIVGEEGVITWSFTDNNVGWFSGKEGRWHISRKKTPYDVNEMYVEEMKHFLCCLEGEESPLVDARAGEYTLSLALAAKQSAERRCPVILSEDEEI